jgi:CPA2 family monovalent cation:H+ antiporter-2
MVLLSTIAVTQAFEGTQILFTILKLVFFLILWFIGGIFLLPTFLKRARSLLDDETLLILSIGLCLGMVVLATQVGFSAELGAFIMGSIIAETTKAEKVEHLIKPVKDLFGSIFFVSVGMMIDPNAIAENAWPVAAVTALTLFGKLFSTTLGALLSGQPLKQSVQVGMSMAQIGEFAFIVATLGLSLGVISEFLFPVAVGASAITTFTTPYMIRYSEPFYRFIEKILPERWVKKLNRYSTSTQAIQTESRGKIVLRSYLTIMATNGIVLLALMLTSINFFLPFLRQKIEDNLTGSIVGLIISLVLAAPFLWALMAKRPNNMAYKEVWMEEKYNRGPLLILEIVRIVIGIGFISFWVFRLFDTGVAMLIAVPTIVIILFVLAKRIQAFYQRLETRFLKNFNAREINEYNTVSANIARKNADMRSELLPWDAHITELKVQPRAGYVGRTLRELGWREVYGINVVYIKRGDRLINVPDRSTILLPFDEVGIIGTDEQIQEFSPVFDALVNVGAELDADEIALQKIVVDEHTQLKGKDIRSSGIRERTNGLVIGIERNNERILNPDSTMIFEHNDVIWIVGEKKKIQELSSSAKK